MSASGEHSVSEGATTAGASGERATPARGPGPSEPMRGPGRFMSGMSTEKALDFKGSGRRLLATLRPYRLLTILALTLAVGSVVLSVLEIGRAHV